MKIYTREETIQALKACSNEFEPECEHCPLLDEKEYDSATYVSCIDVLMKSAAKFLEETILPKQDGSTIQHTTIN